MRGRDFNTGLRGGLFEVRHYERMGSAVWLFAWLVLRQTHQTGTMGWVLGGAPVSYREIEEETGFNVRTLERWMRTLRRHGYIEAEPAAGGLIVRIIKAKKHSQATRNFTSNGRAETLRRAADGIRKIAGAVRKNAEGDTQTCVAQLSELSENTHVRTPIGSSFIEESVEKYATSTCGSGAARNLLQTTTAPQTNSQTQKPDQNQTQPLTPSCSGERQNPNFGQPPALTRELFADPGRTPQVRVQAPVQTRRVFEEARLLQQIWRVERDEAVQRELRVGRGPEVPASARTSPGGSEVEQS